MTTLFFRVEKEDDYRIRGLSKERHLGLQIVIGFLVDERGFPVQLHSFEGNKAETLTLVPVLDAFRRAHPNVTVSVACDAGMLSASNLTALEDAGYGFIVGSRIAKTPYDIAEYPNDGSALANGQILDTTVWFRRAGSRRQRRVVCQYRQKRARLDLRNIDTQVEKANRIIEGTSAMKKGRFLKVAGATKALDTALVASAKSRAGIKGYVTNLDTAPPKQSSMPITSSSPSKRHSGWLKPIYEHARSTTDFAKRSKHTSPSCSPRSRYPATSKRPPEYQSNAS